MQAQPPRSSVGPTMFPRFLDLPRELQLHTWELLLDDFTFLAIQWKDHGPTTYTPIISIPQLGDAPPGFIPCVLPSGIPDIMAEYPLPLGFPGPNCRGIRDNWYHDLMESKPSSAHLSERLGQHRGLAALRSVCQSSREQFMRHVIKDSKTQLQPNRVARNDPRKHLYAVRNGVILGSLFSLQRQHARPWFVSVLAPNASDSTAAPRIGTDFVPGKLAYVAARLGDIEKCIFGHRLSLMKQYDDVERLGFAQLDSAMFWRPELGYRARRPEACHPYHLPPRTLIWIYSTVLHNAIAASRKHPLTMQCIVGRSDMVDWYFHLTSTGECRACRRPLLRELELYFPEVLGGGEYLDILVLLDEKLYESPEHVVDIRSYETFA